MDKEHFSNECWLQYVKGGLRLYTEGFVCLIFYYAVFHQFFTTFFFQACKLRDAWVSKQEEPPAPKGCSVFDKIPTACDLFNIPCQMMGCMGGSCGGGWSICDWLPSGGRVPPEQRGKKEDECAGFMQSLCQGICATAKREPSAGKRHTSPFE